VKRFAQLYAELDGTNSTNAKLAALERYFREAPPDDAAWAVYFLTGNKPRQVVPSRRMYDLAAEVSGTPGWLMDECYEAVGDLAETVAHILPPATEPTDAPLRVWVEERLLPLRDASDEARAEGLKRAWSELDGTARLVWNKLITGEFRIGASARSVTRALAAISGIDPAVIAHRLAGAWRPSPASFQALVSADGEQGAASRPYPLFLAYAFEGDPATLGDIREWQIEWKWDGIRGQLIRRAAQVYLWSRGDDLINDSFPELVEAGASLPPGTALDGEIVVWEDGRAAPFNALQQRLGRKTPGKALMAKAPATLIAYDLLELHGEDMRARPLVERRDALGALLANAPPSIRLSPVVEAPDWEALARTRAASRERGVEGLMLKRRDAPYGVGRIRGPWWKWKIEPYTVDAVLMYAQRGHGRRASLYTDYTFGVWDQGALVPFAKAYSGLTDAEIRKVDAYVREHTLEKFGPVRVVSPDIVCELAFEGIQRSTRHKSGIAVRFPRIARLRLDKKPAEADSLETIRALLNESRVNDVDGSSVMSSISGVAPLSSRLPPAAER
jgi:DNA ligase 1